MISAEQRLLIHAPIQSLWHLMNDVDQWRHWCPLIKSAEVDEEPDVGVRLMYKTAGLSLIAYVTHWRQLNELAWEARVPGMAIEMNWRFYEEADGCRVNVSATMSGWRTMIFKSARQASLEAVLQQWLDALKEKAESIENAD